jgi:hypothetical protein
LKGKTGETPKQIEFDQHKIFIKAIHEKFKSLLSRPPIVPDSNSKDIKTVINYQKTQNTAKNSTETKQTETQKKILKKKIFKPRKIQLTSMALTPRGSCLIQNQIKYGKRETKSRFNEQRSFSIHSSPSSSFQPSCL